MKNHSFRITSQLPPELMSVVSKEAMDFVAALQEKFDGRRQELLAARGLRQSQLDQGKLLDFLPETKSVREGTWQVAKIPGDLLDRRVEITGPPDRKMVINALNSGAKVFMADFEDSHAPTLAQTLQGQINLQDSIRKTISYHSPEGKKYQLNPTVATLVVRPRGWHLLEKQVLIDDKPISGSLFDFGLYLFHNAHELLKRGTGPYFYLPKMESHLEARLWNDIFLFSETKLDLPKSTIRATVLIETINAAFEMDEILFELKDHCVGLNCGRWDYIFSFIKKFRNHADFVLPDRATVTMNQHFLKSYSLLLIKTCHRRGAFAMGGMAAQIPIKGDEKANAAAIEKVRADKDREVTAGHDGTWVAHPGLVPIAMAVFNEKMPQPNQLSQKREDVSVTAKDLLSVPAGEITEQGLRSNISVGLQYVESWLRGNGCVPINNLMEDAATAEISRAQLWQWIKHPKGVLADGRRVTVALFRQTLDEEIQKIREQLGDETFSKRQFTSAKTMFDKLTTENTFSEFLTLGAYDRLIQDQKETSR